MNERINVKILPETIVFSRKVQTWCALPYEGHPKGCPNRCKNPLCPPNAKYRDDIIKKYQYFTLFIVKFDIEGHAAKMKKEHPEWTDKMCRNLLYWQGSVRKELKEFILGERKGKGELLADGSGFLGAQSMESSGIDVFATLQKNNISFERNCEHFVTKVALWCWNDSDVGIC